MLLLVVLVVVVTCWYTLSNPSEQKARMMEDLPTEPSPTSAKLHNCTALTVLRPPLFISAQSSDYSFSLLSINTFILQIARCGLWAVVGIFKMLVCTGQSRV